MVSPNLRLISLLVMGTILGASLTGCGIADWTHKKLYGDYAIEKLTIKPDPNDNQYQSLLETVNITYKIPDSCVNGSMIPDVSALSDQCKQKRQVVVGDLMGMSDSMCEWHQQTIWGNEASFNLIAGTFTNIFSGAATVVTGGTGQALLAALALFSNATRSLGNETVYKNVLIPAIVSKIKDSRKTKLAAIKRNIIGSGAKSYTEYPINIALLDVIDYHQSCSFMNGLLRAIEEGSRDRCPDQVAKAEERLQLLQLQMQMLSSRNDKNETVYQELTNRYKSMSTFTDNLQKSCIGESAVTSPDTKADEPPKEKEKVEAVKK